MKLIGKRIGYHYLSKHLQVIWKIRSSMNLIDLPNDFYIVKLNKEDYNLALLDGPWMTVEHYLHVQHWRPNLIADSAQIDLLLVWVRFPILPVEYYTVLWLQKASNKIRRTLKVDYTTLSVSRGKFARVCVEVDLNKPLKSIYMLMNKFWNIQYEGLHTLCFKCERYGHTKDSCADDTIDGQNENQQNIKHKSSTI